MDKHNMNDTHEMGLEIKSVLENLANEELTSKMYGIVCSHQTEFVRMGILPSDLRELIELKQKLTFLPEACAYSLSRPGRGDYILANFDSLNLTLKDTNEERFITALYSYYQMKEKFHHKMFRLSTIAKNHLQPIQVNHSYRLGEKQEMGLLIDMLLGKDIDGYPYQSAEEQKGFLEKFDLYDAYHLDDNKMTLRLKAGEVLESKRLIDRCFTERALTDGGVSVSKLKDGLYRYRVDKLRVSKVEIQTEPTSGSKYIRCYVDGDYQHVRRLSAKDVELLDKLGNITGMAVKYFADVLDKNRRERPMIADEKILARMSMPYVDRLIDIYRNGMNEQDLMLAKASEFEDVDSFWRDSMMLGLEQYSIEEQKEFAFDTLVDYIKDLMPGQLTDDEVVKLVGVESINSIKGKELESNFMKLPELFFPLIEQCGKYDRKMIDYAKVLREIGKITPTMAYNSMDYFLDQRFREEWDPAGDEDDYGQPIGCYYYPNERMENPAEKFPPNLLNEMQWSALGSKYRGEAASFIPNGAFLKNRITGVQVYASGDDNVNIRCIVDGKQQGGRRLSELDTVEYLFENTDLNELAVKYFEDAFVWEEDRNVSMRR